MLLSRKGEMVIEKSNVFLPPGRGWEVSKGCRGFFCFGTDQTKRNESERPFIQKMIFEIIFDNYTSLSTEE